MPNLICVHPVHLVAIKGKTILNTSTWRILRNTCGLILSILFDAWKHEKGVHSQGLCRVSDIFSAIVTLENAKRSQ